MNYNKIVLFSDLDGTLFDDETKVPKINRLAIEEFCRGGGIFCISSGRIPQNAAAYLSEVPVNGPCILYNGSAIFDWSQKRFLTKTFLSMEPAKELIRKVLEYYPQVDVQVYPGDEICFVSPQETANRIFVEEHRPCRFTTLEQVEKPWLKILMQGDTGDLEKIRDLGQKITDIGEFVQTGVDYLELLPHGVSKGTALKEVMARPELAGRIAVAIGDYYNDLELLMNADVGVAPENGISQVKEVADHLVCDNNKGAVADCIHRVIPLL